MKNFNVSTSEVKKVTKELRVLNLEEMSKIRGGGKIPADGDDVLK